MRRLQRTPRLISYIILASFITMATYFLLFVRIDSQSNEPELTEQESSLKENTIQQSSPSIVAFTVETEENHQAVKTTLRSQQDTSELPKESLKPTDDSENDAQNLHGEQQSERTEGDGLDTDREMQGFTGDPSEISETTFKLLSSDYIEEARDLACKGDTDREECVISEEFLRIAEARSVPGEEARMWIVAVDPLAILKETDREKYGQLVDDLISSLNRTPQFLRFKGSDFIFVCLSTECQEFAKDFAPRLADNKGTRAIFVGIHFEETQIQWPCPYRVIKLDQEEPHNEMEEVFEAIVTGGALMIEKRNRWVCSDKAHPEHHFGKHTIEMKSFNVYVKEFNLVLCPINKSGSTMLMMLARRLMHKEDYLTFVYLVHDRDYNGVTYIGNKIDFASAKALYEEPSVIKAAVVRHPFSRLLSGYLDKIDYLHEYRRLPGMKEYVQKNGHPSFAEFVDFLIERFPDASKIDTHFRYQYTQCGLMDHRYDFIGHLSNMDTEFKEFSQSVGIWDDYVSSGWGKDGSKAFCERKARQNEKEADRQLIDYFTDDITQKVYEYYKEDFTRFGFTVEEIMERKQV